MSKSWHSITTKTNKQFWMHEWEKHGSCQIEDGQTYFSTGIQLLERLNLNSALHDKLHDPTYVDKTEFISVIMTRIGKVIPLLQCVKIYPSPDYQLSEIIICVDKQERSVRSCDVGDERYKDNCRRKQIKIPQ